MIIALSGHMQNGKSTVGTYLSLSADLNGLSFCQFAFADAVKEDALIYGWCGCKDPAGRFLLQTTGEERRRRKLDWWIEALAVRLRDFCAEVNLITDVRHKNEADWVKDEGGEVWRIVRSGFTPEHGQNHVSETDLDGYQFDTTIAAETEDFAPLYSRTIAEFRRICRNTIGAP